jgi:thioredoxin-related protein
MEDAGMFDTVSPPTKAIMCAVALLTLTRTTAEGQEVQWRFDYAAARREAKQKQRPLLIDFGTSNCFWCKKLDASTLRDAEVVRRLNEQFIPLKVDAERDSGLALALQIYSFPTLLFAASDGRILGRQEGFVDVARFGGRLDSVLKESKPPAGIEESPLLRQPGTLPTGSAGSGQVGVRVTIPPSSPVVTDQPPSARELLERARQDRRQRQFLGCLECCATLASTYPDSPEGEEARQLVLQLKNDPAVARRICQQLADQLAELYLARAESAVRANDPGSATICLERVLQVSPGSERAETARLRLDQLQKSLAGQPVPAKTIRAQAP